MGGFCSPPRFLIRLSVHKPLLSGSRRPVLFCAARDCSTLDYFSDGIFVFVRRGIVPASVCFLGVFCSSPRFLLRTSFSQIFVMGSVVNCVFTISMFIVVMIFGLLHCFLSTISMVIVAGESRDHATCFSRCSQIPVMGFVLSTHLFTFHQQVSQRLTNIYILKLPTSFFSCV